MSIDHSDLVDAALSEQERRNAAFIDQPDTNDLITDFFPMYPVETIGFQPEALAGANFAAPHTWGDGSEWGFAQWGATVLIKTRWGVGNVTWGGGATWGN